MMSCFKMECNNAELQEISRFQNIRLSIYNLFYCRYNPENLGTLERYVDMQIRENTYDLEANLGVLKL